MLQLAEKIQELQNSRQSFVLVTLMGLRGSVPQVAGAKMLVTTSGLYWGTVGGGKIEAHSIQYAQNLLSGQQDPHAQTWNLQKDIGMSCGGEVTMFFDISKSVGWHISVFGAGHVAQELCRVLATWSCHVSVFDPRAEWLERLPSSANIDKKLSAQMGSEVANLPSGSYLLSLTQGHGFDVPVLSAAFKRFTDFSFIGVIGSDVKAKKIKAELLALGANPDLLQKLVCPLGLPIGNNTPNEIAISICAQLLAVRDQSSFRIERGLYD